MCDTCDGEGKLDDTYLDGKPYRPPPVAPSDDPAEARQSGDEIVGKVPSPPGPDIDTYLVTIDCNDCNGTGGSDPEAVAKARKFSKDYFKALGLEDVDA